ncbi:hypothetical protein [Shewanella acanthi]|uniref:hypothetical protein n=1 Tax=Shewanella acanthi TaxID=2864212 RepID=UPI001C661A3B|nr:hypothetical protein [Shewanella acanthi]QYJ79937.1 hypothetical protein K0H61_05855 [Shewanella acanthi]
MKLIIPALKRSVLETVLNNIDTSYPTAVLSFIIDKKAKTATIISGLAPQFAQCVISIDPESSELKDTQFAIDGCFGKQLLQYDSRPDKNVLLDIEMVTATEAKCIELVGSKSDKEITGTVALYRCQCQKIETQHLKYVKDCLTRSMTTVSTMSLGLAINEACNNMPFAYIELNKDTKTIKLQRNDEIEEKAFPAHLKLAVNLVLTEAATTKLKSLCNDPSVTSIDIAQQGEELTFSTGEQTITTTISGIDAFFKQKSPPNQVIRYLIVDIYTIKNEVQQWVKHHNNIKKADEAILYIDNTSIAIFALNAPYEFVRRLKVHEISPLPQGFDHQAFRFRPKELLEMKIKDLTRAQQTKLEILQGSKGELKLGLYSTLENKLPTYSIAIENSDYQLPKILKLIEKMKTTEMTTPKEEQVDLFGFRLD